MLELTGLMGRSHPLIAQTTSTSVFLTSPHFSNLHFSGCSCVLLERGLLRMEPEGGDFRQHLANMTTDGDGAFVHASSATVIIKNNASGVCHAQNGISLFFQDCRDIKLSRCLFTDCSESGDGGSVFVENHNSPNASIVLEVCSFADCPAERGGGFLVSASAPSNGRLGSHSRSTAGYNHEGGCSECLVTIWIVLNTHKLSPSGEDGSAQTSLTFPPKHPSCCRHHFLLNGHFTTNPSMSSAPGSSPADAFCPVHRRTFHFRHPETRQLVSHHRSLSFRGILLRNQLGQHQHSNSSFITPREGDSAPLPLASISASLSVCVDGGTRTLHIQMRIGHLKGSNIDIAYCKIPTLMVMHACDSRFQRNHVDMMSDSAGLLDDVWIKGGWRTHNGRIETSGTKADKIRTREDMTQQTLSLSQFSQPARLFVIDSDIPELSDMLISAERLLRMRCADGRKVGDGLSRV
ncbi:hypothetical protein BLNAU_16210 [Blattamonas nauphoetae]|uniref:Right handed beta helix domain-containing protein n=1 Tax=Blattamonas nauphoetae TaxID=2049346 RepID=A0ABQ9XDY4_9EUKA|nr:hypothetical protein BLNAU_16210 [Blattamonas nauphoetae]